VRYNSCADDCAIAFEPTGALLVASTLTGVPQVIMRGPPAGPGIARHTAGDADDLERISGNNGFPLTCPADCTGGEGPAGNISIGAPRSLVVHGGDLYFVERQQNRIRRIRAGDMSTLMGVGADGGDYGPARDAALSQPMAIAVSPEGHVIVADTGHNEVRLIW
jgi:hypothetical protein